MDEPYNIKFDYSLPNESESLYDVKIDYNYSYGNNPVDTGSCTPASKASTAIDGLVVTITFADGHIDSFMLPITDYSGDISEKANDVDVLHKTGNSQEVILGNDTAKPLSDFATSSQGAKADSAIQQQDLVDYLNTLDLPSDVDVLAIAIDLQIHLEDFTNPHNVTKTQVGLGDVDNTSDTDKPVSNAQQLAIAQAKNAAINTANLGLAKKVDKVAGSRLINTGEVEKLELFDEKHYKSPVQTLEELTAIPEIDLDDNERRFVGDEKQDYFYIISALQGTVAPDDQTNTQGFWISIEDILKSEDIWKDAVDLATTSDITLSGEQTIDGVLTTKSTVLVKDKTDATLNGLYRTSLTGWTRLNAELSGSVIRVKKGIVNTNQIFLNTNDSVIIGTTTINFINLATTIVEDQIVEGVINKSPSQNAVFNALTLKVDKDGNKVLSDVNFSSTKDTKLSSIENNATADQTATEIVAAIDLELGSSEWKTQKTQEQIEDIIAAMFQAGTQTNVSVVYDDALGTISITGTPPDGATLTDEQVQDIVGAFSASGTGIIVGYDDVLNSMTFSLSGESFTTAYRTKLDGISAGATVNSTDAQLRDRSTHTGTQAATTIVESTTKRFVTDAEKAIWNNAGKRTIKSISSLDMPYTLLESDKDKFLNFEDGGTVKVDGGLMSFGEGVIGVSASANPLVFEGMTTPTLEVFAPDGSIRTVKTYGTFSLYKATYDPGFLLSGDLLQTDVLSYALSSPTTDLAAGDADSFTAPYDFTLNGFFIGLNVAPTGSAFVGGLKKNTVSVTSSDAIIDAGEFTSLTGTAPVITTTSFLKGDVITPTIVQVGSLETGKSYKIYLQITKI